MKHSSEKLTTVCIFIVATALFVLYLLSVRWHIYLSPAVFWIAVTSMLSTIIYQCLKIELSPSFTKLVLSEITVTCFVLHMIYQIPYEGLRGYDAYVDMASAKGIQLSGFVMGEPQYINVTSYFPIVHILGVILASVTNIDLFSVVKWFPSVFDAVLILLLYLFVRRIFKEEKIALLSALMFAFLQHHILLSSLFIRETIALVLAVCSLYLYFSAKHSSNPTTYYAFSIMCLVETVFAHHLTSFMLLLFLAIHLSVTKFSEVPFLRKALFGYDVYGEKVTATFLSVLFVTLFSYWIYVVMSPLYTLITFAAELFTPNQYGVGSYAQITGISGTSILTIRGYIVFYGFYLFHLIFGLILLYGLFPRAKNRRIEICSSTSFLFICGLLGFMSLYFVEPSAFPDRFLMFGWLFGFAPLIVTALRKKHKWLRKMFVFLVIAFMLYNIYTIKPVDYDPREEGVVAVTSEEDYSLANTFDFSGAKIYGHQNAMMAIYDVHNNLGTIFTLSSKANLTKYDWIIIQKKALESEKKYYPKPRTETIATLQCLATEGSIDYNKIYESDGLLVFKRRQ